MPKYVPTKSHTILKYVICEEYPLVDSPLTISCLPGDILDVQIQAGQICVWMFVDTLQKSTTRTFMILPTGHISVTKHQREELEYLKTLQHGMFIWHVFEIKDEE